MAVRGARALDQRIRRLEKKQPTGFAKFQPAMMRHAWRLEIIMFDNVHWPLHECEVMAGTSTVEEGEKLKRDLEGSKKRLGDDSPERWARDQKTIVQFQSGPGGHAWRSLYAFGSNADEMRENKG